MNIINEAAKFAFPKGARWTSVSEVKLLDSEGKSAGNIDYVVARLDAQGRVVDFASVEVQGVYISGNLRDAFTKYMEDGGENFEWDGKNYPRLDYLSSSRKRLLPQLLHKGGIFKSWNKKQCVAIQKQFYDTLPPLPETDKKNADIAWFLYDLRMDEDANSYRLFLSKTVYTEFAPALNAIITPKPGRMDDFVNVLQGKLEAKNAVEPDKPQSIFDPPSV